MKRKRPYFNLECDVRMSPHCVQWDGVGGVGRRWGLRERQVTWLEAEEFDFVIKTKNRVNTLHQSLFGLWLFYRNVLSIGENFPPQ